MNLLRPLICLWLCFAGILQAQNEPPEGLPPEVELEELRLVVRTLAEENRKLKAELEALRAANTPPTSVPQADASRTGTAPESRTNPPTASSAQVLYVNPTWHYLLVNRGSSSGVQKEQTLSVTRNGVLIAHGVVTEVKPDQCVAEIDLESIGAGGVYPRVGDQVQAR